MMDPRDRRGALFEGIHTLIARTKAGMFSAPFKDEVATTLLAYYDSKGVDISTEAHSTLLSDVKALLSIFHAINVEEEFYDKAHLSVAHPSWEGKHMSAVTTRAFEKPRGANAEVMMAAVRRREA